MKHCSRIKRLHKIASKAAKKRASGINWTAAELALEASAPGVKHSREQVMQQIAESPLFSEEDLGKILNLNIESHHSKLLNKQEALFIEIGAFLSSATDQISEIGDYLQGRRSAPGYVSANYNTSLDDLELAKAEFQRLNSDQVEWHRAAAVAQATEAQAEGKFGSGYMTNEIVAEYEDGWRVVYVPAAGEGPDYKGDPSKSNDRTIEGNLNGLCLGSAQGLYQDNASGKIYSVRDSKNKPHVTIRISGKSLMEAKGKNNLPPSVAGAKVAKLFFRLLASRDGLSYERNPDYEAFPPTDKDLAIASFRQNPEEMYHKGWVSSWYGQGIEELDKDVSVRIAKYDIKILYSGIGKRYKELAAPVVKYWADKYVYEDSSEIFGNMSPDDAYQLSHESWKTYKKESWMQNAVKKLIVDDNTDFAFRIGIQRIPEYEQYARTAAKNFASRDPASFFDIKIHETYPELGISAAEEVARYRPRSFFIHYSLHEVEAYKKFGKLAAKTLAADDHVEFLKEQNIPLYKAYPDEGRFAAKRLARTDPAKLFRTREIRHSAEILKAYPDVGRLAAKNLARNDHEVFMGNVQINDNFAKLYKDLSEIVAVNHPEYFIDRAHWVNEPAYTGAAWKSLGEADPEKFVKKYMDPYAEGAGNLEDKYVYDPFKWVMENVPVLLLDYVGDDNSDGARQTVISILPEFNEAFGKSLAKNNPDTFLRAEYMGKGRDADLIEFAIGQLSPLSKLRFALSKRLPDGVLGSSMDRTMSDDELLDLMREAAHGERPDLFLNRLGRFNRFLIRHFKEGSPDAVAEILDTAAAAMVKHDPFWFFNEKWRTWPDADLSDEKWKFNRFPSYAKDAAKVIAESNPREFANGNIWRIFPDVKTKHESVNSHILRRIEALAGWLLGNGFKKEAEHTENLV